MRALMFDDQDEDFGGDELAALWALRALDAGTLRAFVQRSGPLLDDDEARSLGFKKRVNLQSASTRQALARRRKALEAKPPRREGELFRNVDWLGDALGLVPVERELLILAVTMQRNELLKQILASLSLTALYQLHELIARILAAPLEAVRKAAHPDAQLARTQLLHVQVERRQRMGRHFLHELEPFTMMDGLSTMLLGNHADADALMQEFFRAAPASRLTLEDFGYATESVALLRGILAGALAARTPGVNVCIHGASGVGKTQLARALAQAMGAALFEVPFDDGEGDALPGPARLGKTVVAGRLLHQRAGALLLFDEMEDAFARSPFAFLRDKTGDKAWTNRLLEENPVPTVWLSNAIGHIDAAYLRRFHFVLELEAPPAPVRGRMLASAVGDLPLRPEWLARVAADDRLSPGIVERAAAAVRLAGITDGLAAEQAMDRLLAGTLPTQGPSRRRGVRTDRPAPYDLAYVNADRPLEPIVAGLAKRGRGTLCLYGPPGTGKTAFAAHLAERAGRPLIMKRASDLLGSLVGQTEQAIAEMFERARRERAVLFLDEADSFLRDRAGALRSWEVTQVNELLVQMEAFEGIFVCATNLFESFDQASLRRFALKVRFDPMTLDQSVELFRATLVEAGAPAPDLALVRGELARLPGLCPGDFATIVRQAAVLDDPLGAERLLSGLAEEWKVKRGAMGRRVGFV